MDYIKVLLSVTLIIIIPNGLIMLAGRSIQYHEEVDKNKKIIIGFCSVIIIIQYLYTLFNFSISNISLILLYISCFACIKEIYYKKFNIPIVIIIYGIIITIYICFNYEEKSFYIFRGNHWDAFNYLMSSSGYMNNKYNDLELGIDNIVDIAYKLKDKRPAISMLIATVSSAKFIDLIQASLIIRAMSYFMFFIGLKSLISELMRSKYYPSSKYLSTYISLCFVFSPYGLYPFEIDAYSHMFIMGPALLLISNIINITLNNSKIKSDISLIFTSTLLLSTIITVYIEYAALLILCIIITTLLLYKDDNKAYKKLVYILILSIILSAPLYETILLFVFSQIKFGLNNDVNWWGYFGGFFLGSDPLILKLDSVENIKRIIYNYGKFDAILYIIKSDHISLLDIYPSVMNFYFLTGYIKKYTIIKIIINLACIYYTYYFCKNIFNVFKKKLQSEYILASFGLVFILFSLYLILASQYWSFIKLLSYFSPVLFVLTYFKFKNNNNEIKKITVIIISLWLIFPIYKYYNINNGIGRIDSYPSILNRDLKDLFFYDLDYKKFIDCNVVIVPKINDHYIKYIEIIFSNKNIMYIITDNFTNLTDGNRKLCKMNFKFENGKYFLEKEIIGYAK